jgi:hypothetical protein
LAENRSKEEPRKEHLQRIIDFCRSIEERGIDPFLLSIDDALGTLDRLYPEWKEADELCLDAEAVDQIASTVKVQSDWVKHRSTSLYTDPFLIEEKLQELPKEEICSVFLKAWHPIVELEQISAESLKEATKYWKNLTPLADRWGEIDGAPTETGATTREELLKQRIIAETEFSEQLHRFWNELKTQAQDTEKVEYWDFVGAETYEETVKRAYLTSFLVTYGYATLEVDRLEEIIYVVPFDNQAPRTGKRQAQSLPIPLSVEDWEKWREGVRD